jgi:hypothetical protein
VQRLKILIHGQEVETLAGHLDLTGTFLVNSKGSLVAPSAAVVAPVPAPAAPPSADKQVAPETDKPSAAPATKPSARAATPDKGLSKPAQPEKKM